MQLYEKESSHPLPNAQRNLRGRTHYVDDDMLRFHKSRVISARHTDGGLLFAIVTSDALDYENTKRGFRYVIFDVTGYVVERTDIKDAYRTSAKCTTAMWAALERLNAYDITAAALERTEKQQARELHEMRVKLEALRSAAAART